MKAELAGIMICPRCYSDLDLEIDRDLGGYVYEGELTCRRCRAVYPVHKGIAYVAVIDRTWKPVVKELLSRVEISGTVLFEGGFERDREEESDEQVQANADVMDRLFNHAAGGLEVGEGTRILDLGAGTCETSEHFADLGADVVAADVEYTHLQYVRFAGVDAEDTGSRYTGESPRSTVQRKLRFKLEGADSTASPEICGTYFSRVMSDIHRIPFKDGSFDITFCRSTIHHLGDMRVALKEMARVTRPGGKVLLISEPVRSILDREIDYLKGIFDYEEGLNEQTPPITRYTLPLKPYCGRLEVRYFNPWSPGRAYRILEALKVDPQSRFVDSERVGFWGSFKLLFSGAAVNVTGTRSGRRAGKPKPADEGDVICDLEELVFSGEPAGGETDGDRLKKHIQRLRRLYCRFIDAGSLPLYLEASIAGQEAFRKGFREPEDIPGRPFRFTHKVAFCYLGNDPDARGISLSLLGYPEGAGEATGDIYVNGEKGCSFRIPGWDWITVTFEKQVAAEEILEIEIVNDSLFVPDEVLHNGDSRELGVGVERIWQE